METFGISIYKEYFNFAAAHFLIFEDGTREELHGHNYQVKFEIEGSLSPDNDIFIDFLHIKPLIKAFCDEIDHLTLLPQYSPLLEITERGNQVHVRYTVNGDEWLFPKRDVKILPVPNTSAERFAQYISHKTLAALLTHYPEATITRAVCSVEESKGQAAVYKLKFNTPTPLQQIVDDYTLTPDFLKFKGAIN